MRKVQKQDTMPLVSERYLPSLSDELGLCCTCNQDQRAVQVTEVQQHRMDYLFVPGNHLVPEDRSEHTLDAELGLHKAARTRHYR